MIHDYEFAPTPALARRLLALSAICHLELHEGVASLAGQDLLSSDGFEAGSPLRRAAAQFLLDSGLRGVLPSLDPVLDRRLVVDTIAASGVTPVTIISRHAGSWRKALRGSVLRHDALVGNVDAVLDLEAIAGRRDGVLVMDWQHSERFSRHAKMAVLAREFPRTLIFCDTDAVAAAQQADFGLSVQGPALAWVQRSPTSLEWDSMARVLFPDMPREVFSQGTASRWSGLAHGPAWRVTHRDELCLLFNVFLPHVVMREPGTQARG